MSYLHLIDLLSPPLSFVWGFSIIRFVCYARMTPLTLLRKMKRPMTLATVGLYHRQRRRATWRRSALRVHVAMSQHGSAHTTVAETTARITTALATLAPTRDGSAHRSARNGPTAHEVCYLETTEPHIYGNLSFINIIGYADSDPNFIYLTVSTAPHIYTYNRYPQYFD